MGNHTVVENIFLVHLSLGSLLLLVCIIMGREGRISPKNPVCPMRDGEIEPRFHQCYHTPLLISDCIWWLLYYLKYSHCYDIIIALIKFALQCSNLAFCGCVGLCKYAKRRREPMISRVCFVPCEELGYELIIPV